MHDSKSGFCCTCGGAMSLRRDKGRCACKENKKDGSEGVRIARGSMRV